MEADVRIMDFGFEPRETHVAPGASVRWTNHGAEEHDVIVHAYDPPGEERGSPGPAFLFIALGAVGAGLLARRAR
jgi:plastocyanin